MSGFAGADSSGSVQQGSIGVGGANIGSELEKVLLCDEIVPGSEIGYELAKIIYTYHPLGAKLVDTPLKMAMSQERTIAMPTSPDAAVDAFRAQWKADGADAYILNFARLSRIYGISTLVFGVEGDDQSQDVDITKIPDGKIYFNALDPLNTSGSLVLNQDPNAPDFQKLLSVSVSGQIYARSRVCVMMNEQPIYIDYTSSAFGFVGRSVYQRPLFALKTFLQTMLTDDMVSQKAGVLVAKIKPAGSIMDRVMSGFNTIKRIILKGSRNNNVISIGPDDSIESINLQGLEAPAKNARENVLQNIAMATDMPSQLVANETFVSGFAEGTEESKHVAHYIDGVRKELDAAYTFVTNIIQIRAWTPAFFETMKEQYPETYGNMKWKEFLYTLKNDFKAEWPSLLTEPESEKIKVEEAKLKALVDVVTVLQPSLDPNNVVRLLQWLASNLNENEMLFKTPLHLDEGDLLEFLQKAQKQAEELAANPVTPQQDGKSNVAGPNGTDPDKQNDTPTEDDDGTTNAEVEPQKMAA